MRVRIDSMKLTLELKRRFMSQKDLTELSGVSRATLSGIMNGKSCYIDTARKIADALGLDVRDILEPETQSVAKGKRRQDMTQDKWLDASQEMTGPILELMAIVRKMDVDGSQPVTLAINKMWEGWALFWEAGHKYEAIVSQDGNLTVKRDGEEYFSGQGMTATPDGGMTAKGKSSTIL